MTFFKGSRYEKVGEVELTEPSGRVVRYKRVRFIAELPVHSGHAVTGHDRLDRLAHDTFNNPELYWLLCDANKVIWPPDLLAEIGTVIGIPDADDTP
jgi:hypothetical protein